MKTSFVAASFGAILAAAALTACVVVPVGPDGRAFPLQPMPTQHPATPTVVAPPAPAVRRARLYPLNSTAQASGLAAGQVTNYLDGKGSFNIQIGGEQFSGEATRASRGASTPAPEPGPSPAWPTFLGSLHVASRNPAPHAAVGAHAHPESPGLDMRRKR